MCSLSAVCCKQHITLILWWLPCLSSVSFGLKKQNWTLDDRFRAITSHVWHVAGNLRSKSKVVWKKRFRLWRRNVKQRLSTIGQSEGVFCEKTGIQLANSRVPHLLPIPAGWKKGAMKALWLSCLLQIPWQKFIRRKVTKQSWMGT